MVNLLFEASAYPVVECRSPYLQQRIYNVLVELKSAPVAMHTVITFLILDSQNEHSMKSLFLIVSLRDKTVIIIWHIPHLNQCIVI